MVATISWRRQQIGMIFVNILINIKRLFCNNCIFVVMYTIFISTSIQQNLLF